ncbi:MAG: colanic acid/amylovoran biosynthesis glycosyltransferase [Candidatus Omnitrophota bacterium]|jgi:colanic acid/amylovoran biosynthesis glycosyltransferase
MNPPDDQPLRVAYLMSRFPKLTETFILYEMLALKELHTELEIHPLLRARNTSTHPEGAGMLRKFLELLRKPDTAAVMHPEVSLLMDQVYFSPLLSFSIVGSNLIMACSKPKAYFGTLFTLIRENAGSTNFLLGSLTVFPKTVAAARGMKKRGVQHVHAHFVNHPAAMAWVIHRLTGIPFSFTAHGADLQVDQHMLCRKIADAAFSVTISDYNRRFMIEHCGEATADAIQVIRCGVDRSVFTKHPRSATSDTMRLLCIGTLYEVKGQIYLLRACKRLLDASLPFTCRLIGDGPDLESLKAEVLALGLSEHVVFLGRQTRQEIVAMIGDTDIQVVPSVSTTEGRREGIPVVCMEGMAGGAILVASDISGIPELVEHEQTGLLVPPRDPEAIAAAILRLANDPTLRRQLADGAERKIRASYDQTDNARHLKNHILEHQA